MVFEIYKQELGGIKYLQFQKLYDCSESSYWLICIKFEEDRIDITKLQTDLKRKNIPTRRVFMPLTELKPYMHSKKTNLKNSYRIFQNSICLPSSTINDQKNIVASCKILKKLIY